MWHTAPTIGIMVWGAIAYNSRSPLVLLPGTITATSYVENVLESVGLPFVQSVTNGIFQQDNVRPHVARSTLRFLDKNNVNVMPWPARSPDLSPIESLWDMIGCSLLRNADLATTRNELWNQVNTAWEEIPEEKIFNLILSVNNCIKKK